MTVTSEGFQVGARWVPAREQWFVVRKVLMTHVKSEQARRLSEETASLWWIDWVESQAA